VSKRPCLNAVGFRAQSLANSFLHRPALRPARTAPGRQQPRAGKLKVHVQRPLHSQDPRATGIGWDCQSQGDLLRRKQCPNAAPSSSPQPSL
jgi:hypothetical protein